ncbi:hypothetical protein DY000_02003792 [Brassica cretica]|uniref:Uncharacterized protein n=1 Tax=Brassica cretica TaxID=69181 RepID=A0ABQ7C8X6_BRACR|nr:hypothetical protein DY000_02003792 [Brassica cretica]
MNFEFWCFDPFRLRCHPTGYSSGVALVLRWSAGFASGVRTFFSGNGRSAFDSASHFPSVFSPSMAELLLSSSLLPVHESGHLLTCVHASPGERKRGGRRITLFLNGFVLWA